MNNQNKLDLKNKLRYTKSSLLALNTNLANLLNSLILYLKLDKVISIKSILFIIKFLKYLFAIIFILNIIIFLVWLIHSDPFTTIATIMALVIGWFKAVWSFYRHIASQSVEYLFNYIRYGFKGAEYIANQMGGGWFSKPKVIPIPSVENVAHSVRESLRPLEP
jgi:hypothetical protein